MSLQVARIEANDTHTIRHKMLRQDFTREECIFPGDEDEQSFHLGGFIEGKLVSVASFYFEKHPDLPDEYQYRLRGMATLEEHQKLGLSSALLKMAFPIIKQNQCSMLWCNAREFAVGYYQQVGFEKVGESFDIPGIGPHLLMFKRIS